MPLQIGYAQQSITPSLAQTVFLAGFGQNRRAEGIHDELLARALAILPGEEGSPQVVLTSLDLLGLTRQHWQAIEQRVNENAPGTYVLGTCTHNHQGPDTLGMWGSDMTTSGIDPSYLDWLEDQVVETILAALADAPERTGESPVYLKAVSVHVPGMIKNTRDPDIVDDELFCLQFGITQNNHWQPAVTLVDFPCHAEVLWKENNQISADYPGTLCKDLEEGSGAPCIFFAGDMGGLLTPDVRDHTFEEADRFGNTLARAAISSLRENFAIHMEIVSDQVQPTRVEFTIPMSNPLFQMAMGTGLLANVLNDQMEIETEVNLLKIGPIWLAGVPGEVLPKLGLALKALLLESGADLAAIIGLANDELGYILPKEEYIFPENPFEPGEHYEETMSIGPEAGPQVVAALREMM